MNTLLKHVRHSAGFVPLEQVLHGTEQVDVRNKLSLLISTGINVAKLSVVW